MLLSLQHPVLLRHSDGQRLGPRAAAHSTRSMSGHYSLQSCICLRCCASGGGAPAAAAAPAAGGAAPAAAAKAEAKKEEPSEEDEVRIGLDRIVALGLQRCLGCQGADGLAVQDTMAVHGKERGAASQCRAGVSNGRFCAHGTPGHLVQSVTIVANAMALCTRGKCGLQGMQQQQQRRRQQQQQNNAPCTQQMFELRMQQIVQNCQPSHVSRLAANCWRCLAAAAAHHAPSNQWLQACVVSNATRPGHRPVAK